MADFRVALLKRLGAPPTPENLKFLNAWIRAEGTSAANNPLATTHNMPGATAFNSVGVRNFRSFNQGVEATYKTLTNGLYDNIVNGLRSGNASAVQLGQAVAGSPWGTGAGVLRVLGANGQNIGSLPSASLPEAPKLDIRSMVHQNLQDIARGEFSTAKRTKRRKEALTQYRKALGAFKLATPRESLTVAPSGDIQANIDRHADFAARFGLNITSSFRDPEANRATGGAPRSNHLRGDAIDISVTDAAKRAYEFALANPHLFKEAFYDPVGRYIKNGKIIKGAIGGHSDHIHFSLAG